jgi:hypothetical protein
MSDFAAAGDSDDSYRCFNSTSNFGLSFNKTCHTFALSFNQILELTITAAATRA